MATAAAARAENPKTQEAEEDEEEEREYWPWAPDWKRAYLGWASRASGSADWARGRVEKVAGDCRERRVPAGETVAPSRAIRLKLPSWCNIRKNENQTPLQNRKRRKRS